MYNVWQIPVEFLKCQTLQNVDPLKTLPPQTSFFLNDSFPALCSFLSITDIWGIFTAFTKLRVL